MNPTPRTAPVAPAAGGKTPPRAGRPSAREGGRAPSPAELLGIIQELDARAARGDVLPTNACAEAFRQALVAATLDPAAYFSLPPDRTLDPRADLNNLTRWALRIMRDPEKSELPREHTADPLEDSDVLSGIVGKARLSIVEIAEVFGVDPNNLRKRLARLRDCDPSCCEELADPRDAETCRSPRLLFFVYKVLPVIRTMKRVSQ